MSHGGYARSSSAPEDAPRDPPGKGPASTMRGLMALTRHCLAQMLDRANAVVFEHLGTSWIKPRHLGFEHLSSLLIKPTHRMATVHTNQRINIPSAHRRRLPVGRSAPGSSALENPALLMANQSLS